MTDTNARLVDGGTTAKSTSTSAEAWVVQRRCDYEDFGLDNSILAVTLTLKAAIGVVLELFPDAYVEDGSNDGAIRCRSASDIGFKYMADHSCDYLVITGHRFARLNEVPPNGAEATQC